MEKGRVVPLQRKGSCQGNEIPLLQICAHLQHAKPLGEDPSMLRRIIVAVCHCDLRKHTHPIEEGAQNDRACRADTSLSREAALAHLAQGNQLTSLPAPV